MIREIQPDILDIITPPDSHEALVRLLLIQGPLLSARNHWPQTVLPHAGWLSQQKQINHFLLSTRTSFLNLGTEKSESAQQSEAGELYTVSFRLRPGDGRGSEAYLNRQPYFQQMERFLVHETGIHFIDTFATYLEALRGLCQSQTTESNYCRRGCWTVLFDFGKMASEV
ncbi:MAG: hypothetical protein CM1200mP18_06990 [Gammaproteobacteria bacterium]|nr:MAG: hypothetical protein CM1200mP18_06990 [Gammaproteobacteria bacterium]